MLALTKQKEVFFDVSISMSWSEHAELFDQKSLSNKKSLPYISYYKE